MAAIFPPADKGGVPPGSNVVNGFIPTNAVIGEGPLYTSSDCTTLLTADQLNAIVSELLAAVDRLGFAFNTDRVTNLGDALQAVLTALDSTKVDRAGDTMLGPLNLSGDPVADAEAANKHYVDQQDLALRTYVDAQDALNFTTLHDQIVAGDDALDQSKVNKSGDTMVGSLILRADPLVPLEAATKSYVDAVAAGGGGGGGIPDAPFDDQTYGRKNATWVTIPPDAPIDGKIYGRLNGNWSDIGAFLGGKYVQYDAAQVLTSAQQLQARQNIYAAPFDAMAMSGLQINGAFEIAQEMPGVVNAPVTNTNKYFCDLWLVGVQHATGTIYGSQAGTNGAAAPFGNALPYALSMSSSPALPAFAATEFSVLTHHIEGSRWARLGFGRAAASPVTIAFWVYSNTVTGTASVSIRNLALTRTYIANFTIDAVNTWEYKTVTIPGCPDGVWDIGFFLGAYVSFCFGAGTNWQAAPNAWLTTVNTQQKFATATTTNFFNPVNAGVSITGVTILPGSQAPSAARHPLIMRAPHIELPLTQRYYRRHTWTIEGNSGGAQQRITNAAPMPAMRAPPGVTRISIAAFLNIRANDPNAFVLCSGTGDGGSLQMSIETAAAGYAQAVNVVEGVTARY